MTRKWKSNTVHYESAVSLWDVSVAAVLLQCYHKFPQDPVLSMCLRTDLLSMHNIMASVILLAS